MKSFRTFLKENKVLSDMFEDIVERYSESSFMDKDLKGAVEFILYEIGEDELQDYREMWREYLNTIRITLDDYGYNIMLDELEVNPLVESFIKDIVDPPVEHETVQIYPEGGTMGWILNIKTGEVTQFEGSDEPNRVDMKFVNAFTEGKWITLYGMHNRDFIMSWENDGIPSETFFAEERSVAERYWHMELGTI